MVLFIKVRGYPKTGGLIQKKYRCSMDNLLQATG